MQLVLITTYPLNEAQGDLLWPPHSTAKRTIETDFLYPDGTPAKKYNQLENTGDDLSGPNYLRQIHDKKNEMTNLNLTDERHLVITL